MLLTECTLRPRGGSSAALCCDRCTGASGGPANLACPVQEAALSVQLLMIGVPTGLAVAGPG